MVDLVPERDQPGATNGSQGAATAMDSTRAVSNALPNATGSANGGLNCQTGLEGLEFRPGGDRDTVWEAVLADARDIANNEPALRKMVECTILQQATLEDAVAARLSSRLGASDGCSLGVEDWRQLLADAFHHGVDTEGRQLGACMRMDLEVARRRDPACLGLGYALLYFKGFQSLQAYRAANIYWHKGRRALALEIQSAVSLTFGLDIHPAAYVGHGVLLDHGTGVVVGETARIGDFCTILHGVTLGGSGKEVGDRHPKLGKNVLVGAGVSILGNIRIGCCSKIGAGSVVLQPIPMGATAVGVPAKVVGRAKESNPAEDMDQTLQQVKLCKAFRNFRSIWDTVKAVRQMGPSLSRGPSRTSFDSTSSFNGNLDEVEEAGVGDAATAADQATVQEPEKKPKYLSPCQVYENLKPLNMDSYDMDNLIFFLDKKGEGRVSAQELKAAIPKFVANVGDHAKLTLPPRSDELGAALSWSS
eukprot:jgi/Mesvir1/27090/Mv20775-RA.1